MDEVLSKTENEYLMLYSEEDAVFLKNYITLLKKGSVKPGLIQSHHNNLVRLLLKQPYPTLQLLHINFELCRYNFTKSIAAALKIYVAEHDKECSANFLSFLANFPDIVLEGSSARRSLLDLLVKTPFDKYLGLALISRETNYLIEELLNYWKQLPVTDEELLSKEYIAYQVIELEQHFLPSIIKGLSDISIISDGNVRNIFVLLKLYDEFSIENKKISEIQNTNKLLSLFKIKDSDTELRENHKIVYNEFQRYAELVKFLKSYPNAYTSIQVGEIKKVTSVLQLMHKYGLHARFDDVHKTMDTIYKLQNHNQPVTKNFYEKELENLIHYSILDIVVGLIFSKNETSTNKTVNIEQTTNLTKLLRKIKNIESICSIIANIFKLLLFRWEDTKLVPKKQPKTKSSTTTKLQLSSSTDFAKSEVELESKQRFLHKAPNISKRYGFVCQGPIFHDVLQLLKKFMTKTLHSPLYKTADTINKDKYQLIMANINEFLWRYAIINRMEKSCNEFPVPFKFLPEEEIHKLIHFHESSIPENTSDEDNPELYHSYVRTVRQKSIKKVRHASFTGDTKDIKEQRKQMDDHKPNKTDDSDQNEQSHDISITNTNYSLNSIVSKLLTSPENLLNMAIANNNYDEAKCIVEHYNLQNEAAEEVRFSTEQRIVKKKLALIYENYLKLNIIKQNTQEPVPTVEQIKSVAAKGFEVSKIISIVDNFARTHPIKQSPNLKELISKLANNRYSFLHLFESHNLNAFVITDLILDLPFNREITSNIIKVIKRQQQMSADIASTSPNDGIPHKEKFSLPSEIGPMSLLENLCECLRLFEQTNDNQIKPMTLRDLLCDNFYSLKPKQLAEELQRKQSFETLFYKTHAEIANYKNLRAYGALIQNVTTKYNFYGRFIHYIGYLNKVMKMRDPNLELHISELLKNDPYCIIGDLIFECNVPPTELEKDAVNLNLNLTHVIALNICPEISDEPILQKPRDIPKSKLDVIYTYINDQSPVLAYLLKCIKQPSYIYEDTTIDLIYLKRYLELPECQKLSKLYGGNLVIAALRSDFVKVEEIERLESKMDQLDVFLTYVGNEEFRKLRNEKIDKIVHDLIEEDSKNIILAKHICNVSLRAQLIQKFYMKIPTSELAQELIELTLSHKLAPEQISLELIENLQQTLSNIKVYDEVSKVLQLNKWTHAYDFGLKSPNEIFEKLLQLQTYELCYNWSNAIDLQKYFNKSKRLLLNTLLDILLRLNDNRENFILNTFLVKIIETFPLESRIGFFDENKDNFHSIAVLEYAIEFLKQNSRRRYRNYEASLKILKALEISERTQFWTLVKFPLLIVEQLIMNARFEKLSRVLQAIRQYIEADNENQRCSFCYDKSGNVYDIHSKSHSENVRFRLGSDTSNSAFILLNFNLYQVDHIITNECIDLLLRIYATKALDYYVSAKMGSLSEIHSQGSEMQSLDSLCGTFQMPKQAPSRDEWVRDEDATHCMCCRRARFTMLMRRHHCRRCGRVVCYACSMYRAFITELYAELPVRVCKDCQENLEKLNNKLVDSSILAEFDSPEFADSFLHYKDINNYKWELSGNITHDKLLREEFGYDHAPSVALCLSILEYHFDQQKCVDLLLYHCRKLEKLIIPNPEVDYELVAKMMNCLALAAKVRGAPAEVETIREHSEIIIAVVHNGCADLIPPGPFNNNSLRKLADSLVKSEHWKLALEVHLKCGFPTAGVMAAHGLACLRAGAYDTARERFTHCMTKTSNNYINSNIIKYIFSSNKIKRDKNEEDISKIFDIPHIKRPNRGPPLLKEILSVLKSIPIKKPPPETLQRASLVRTSNTSLASLFTRRKEQYSVPQHEPALNILTRLANLKNITNGQYSEAGLRHMHVQEYTESEKDKNRQTRNFEESLHYVLTYGSHADILSFLMEHYELNASLRYYLIQNLDAVYFINNIYLKLLPRCQIPDLIKKMQEINDESLAIWRNTLLQTCRYLQKNKLLNSLYHLQILVNDPVRASMTCVKFYSKNCINFRQLHANSEHLHNARMHLQAELEKSEWENIKFEGSLLSGLRKKSFGESSRRASVSSTSTQSGAVTIPMQLDARSLNTHINTVLLQLEVAKFLAKCEAENSSNDEIITEKILKQMRIDSDKGALPTLFESIQDKIQICVLIIYCGKNIDEGFGLAYRIIQDYKIIPLKVYAASAKYLAQNHRLHDVEKLINSITGNNETCTSDIDELLSIAIHSAVNTHDPIVKSTLDNLVKRIEDVELRISAHIFIGQLKSAYLLANKYDRLGDIRKILRKAELLNQIHIKKLCEKKLNIDTNSSKS